MLLTFAIVFLAAQHINANKTCRDLLRELGDTESKFAQCATVHSVPVTFCISCSDMSMNMKNAYAALRNETTCVTKYFDKDRLNLVSSTEAALSGLWAKAYCDSCTLNNTSEFKNRTTELYNCLNRTNEPCKDCMINYQSLNDFYTSLDEYNNGKVCFDIQDSMNLTRNKWSMELKCCRREFKMTLFTVALCIVTCLQFLFYGGAYIVTKRHERNHGILNDDDPLFNSSAPSSSNAAVNLNIRSGEDPSTSAQQSNEQSTSNPSKGFSKLEEETDESDEENLAGK